VTKLRGHWAGSPVIDVGDISHEIPMTYPDPRDPPRFFQTWRVKTQPPSTDPPEIEPVEEFWGNESWGPG